MGGSSVARSCTLRHGRRLPPQGIRDVEKQVGSTVDGALTNVTRPVLWERVCGGNPALPSVGIQRASVRDGECWDVTVTPCDQEGVGFSPERS